METWIPINTKYTL